MTNTQTQTELADVENFFKLNRKPLERSFAKLPLLSSLYSDLMARSFAIGNDNDYSSKSTQSDNDLMLYKVVSNIAENYDINIEVCELALRPSYRSANWNESDDATSTDIVFGSLIFSKDENAKEKIAQWNTALISTYEATSNTLLWDSRFYQYQYEYIKKKAEKKDGTSKTMNRGSFLGFRYLKDELYVEGRKSSNTKYKSLTEDDEDVKTKLNDLLKNYIAEVNGGDEYFLIVLPINKPSGGASGTDQLLEHALGSLFIVGKLSDSQQESVGIDNLDLFGTMLSRIISNSMIDSSYSKDDFRALTQNYLSMTTHMSDLAAKKIRTKMTKFESLLGDYEAEGGERVSDLFENMRSFMYEFNKIRRSQSISPIGEAVINPGEMEKINLDDLVKMLSEIIKKHSEYEEITVVHKPLENRLVASTEVYWPKHLIQGCLSVIFDNIKRDINDNKKPVLEYGFVSTSSNNVGMLTLVLSLVEGKFHISEKDIGRAPLFSRLQESLSGSELSMKIENGVGVPSQVRLECGLVGK